MTLDKKAAIQALRQAVPYLRLFQGEVFVIKTGGDLFQNERSTMDLLEQIGVLHQLGIRVLFVHGGGPQITEMSERLNIETRKVDGRRVTSPEGLEAAMASLGGVLNTGLVAKFRGLNVPAVGISGVDALLLVAEQRAPVKQDDGSMLDYGRVGDVTSVNTALIESLFESNSLPVLCPLAADESGQVLNVNADTVAARLAVELGAMKLICVTDVAGILEDINDASTLVAYTDLGGLRDLADRGTLQGGMLPKAAAIERALVGGVPRVHMISHRVPDSLLLEIFTNVGSGTLVVEDMDVLHSSETDAS
jgi:acetylglutamate kinase